MDTSIRVIDVLALKRYIVGMSSKSKRSTVYLDPALDKALRVKAIETEKSFSDLVNDAIRISLSEDAEDLAAFKNRAKEPNLDFEEVLKGLKKRGKI